MANKSSDDLVNSDWRELGPADRLLFLLKTHGPQTAQELARRLGITSEAVRQQAGQLAGAGLLFSVAEARGVGRPSQVYRLSTAAQTRFPDKHAELTAELLESVRRTLGERALDRLIHDRESRTRQRYRAALEGCRTLQGRVARLTSMRTAEGYMAEYFEKDGHFILIENHCPICAAATVCQGFCRAELEIFQSVLGPDVHIERTEHLLAGSRRCVYQISAGTPGRRLG